MRLSGCRSLRVGRDGWKTYQNDPGNSTEKHPAFTDRKETLKNMPTFKAKRIIYNALDEADLNTAHRVVDRKEGTKVKQEISGEGGGPIKGEWTIKVVG